ncbi:ABC transporter ATP-binding protein [uncultured Pyramidobacter sp.]|uniref:ABC transporter ATP-binding protein n=1 Tax=uncultured Pyramidobacter sp. TaxID=1623495 RepID=UPI002588E579|nr:ABC transporter ATP-binding protein [uncultured Pyramidobacter sp.]
MKRALSVENLSVTYGRGKERLQVLKRASFFLKKGELLTLLGESGSGKTTCGKALLGMLPPSARIESGALRMGDELPLDLASPRFDWRPLRGKRIAMIYQDAQLALNPVETVRAHFLETLRFHKAGSEETFERKSREMLSLLKFEDPERVLDSYPFELSGGMSQRVYIALILCLEPEILIADEPTSALDPDSRREVLTLLKQVQKRLSLSILLITHDIAVPREVGDRVIVLRNGAVVEEGTTEEVLLRPRESYTRSLIEAKTLPERERPPEAWTEPPLLQVRNLCKSFGRNGNRIDVLKETSFDLYRGESVGILGRSGCGKSTLARCIAGLEKVDSGSVVYHGRDITDLRGKRRRWVCGKMQMVFQDARASLNPSRSALQLVQEPLKYLAVGTERSRDEKARYYLEQAGIDPQAQTRRAPQLSTGQCQRVALARALIVEPDVLLCDEAVSALDMILQKQMLELLCKLQRAFGFAVVMISHDMRIVRHFCQRAAIMNDGRFAEIVPAERLDPSGDRALAKSFADGAARVRARP